MPVQSMNDIISAISNGQKIRYDWNKVFGGSAATAGRAYDFSGLNGSPVANAWAGTALTWTPCNEATGNGTQAFGLPHGGNVATNVKHLLNMGAITTAATGVPGTLLLADMEGYYPGISNNTTAAQTLLGSPTLRAPNGAGVRMYWVQTAAAGATAQNIAVSYTNQAGTAGRSLGATTAMTASAIVNHISHAGTAANNYTPFLPLASGDSGVRSAQTVTFSAANTGTGALVLARPLVEIPIGVVSLYHNKDLLGQIPSLPVIPDGACLTWIFIAGGAVAANTAFAGHIEAIWG